MNFFLVRLAVWFVTLVVFPIPLTVIPRSFAVEVLERITLDDAPARECQEPRCVDVNLAERVLLHLEKAERKEIDPWLRDDLRIAWITVQWSQHGVPAWFWRGSSLPPHVAATYQVLDCHPDAVWPRIVAKRKEKLGREYSRWYDEHDRPILDRPVNEIAASSPKKPCASERRGSRRKKAASPHNLAA